MARSPQCAHRNLVRSPVGSVEQCEHGTVHLVLGDLTLRMRPDDLVALSEALAEAALRVDATRGSRLLC